MIEEQGLIAIAPHTTVLPEGFERLFREHAKFIYRTAYRITGNNEDAEDVMQSLFVRLLRLELPPQFDMNPKAYLYRSAVNIALNLVRTRARSLNVGVPAQFLDRPSHQESPAEVEMRETLCEALAELNEKAAEILILRYVHGYSDSEIASLLGTTRGTIAVSLFRSRRRLRKSIRAYLGDAS
jgi:RNA polymerase sigma-70 factor (ECF subfamily)